MSIYDKSKQVYLFAKDKSSSDAQPLVVDNGKLQVDAAVSFNPEITQGRETTTIGGALPLPQRVIIPIDFLNDGKLEGVRILHIPGDTPYTQWGFVIWTKEFDPNVAETQADKEYELMRVSGLSQGYYYNMVPSVPKPFTNEDDPQVSRLYVEIIPELGGGAGPTPDTFVIKLLGE